MQMSDFEAKVHQIRFPLRLCPRSCWGSLQRSPDTLYVFKGPTSKGRVEHVGGEEETKGRRKKSEGKGRRGGKEKEEKK